MAKRITVMANNLTVELVNCRVNKRFDCVYSADLYINGVKCAELYRDEYCEETFITLMHNGNSDELYNQLQDYYCTVGDDDEIGGLFDTIAFYASLVKEHKTTTIEKIINLDFEL